MTFKTRSRRWTYSLVVAYGLALAGSAAAETACKGMSESKCGGADACVWVHGYTTKKGVKVASYCRNKSSKESDSEKMSNSKDKASKPSS